MDAWNRLDTVNRERDRLAAELAAARPAPQPEPVPSTVGETPAPPARLDPGTLAAPAPSHPGRQRRRPWACLPGRPAEFDSVHSIQRAVEVGSVDAIIAPERLRPEIIAAIERGPEGSTSASI